MENLFFSYQILMTIGAVILLAFIIYLIAARPRIKNNKFRLRVYVIAAVIVGIVLGVLLYSDFLFKQREDIMFLTCTDAEVTAVEIKNNSVHSAEQMKVFSSVVIDHNGHNIRTTLQTKYCEVGDVLKVYVLDSGHMIEASRLKRYLVLIDLVVGIFFLFCVGMVYALRFGEGVTLKKHHRHHKHHKHHKHHTHRHHHHHHSEHSHEAGGDEVSEK